MATTRTQRAAIDRRWHKVWAGWIIYFGVAEWVAVKSGDPKAPLSHFLRTTLGIGYHPVYKRAGQVVAGGAIVWLVTHLYEQSPSAQTQTLID